MRRIEGDGPNPSGLCMCGCGQRTAIAAASSRKTGDVAGTPRRFIRGHGFTHQGPRHMIDAETGCWNWQLYKDHQGYGKVFNQGKTRLAHQVAWEEAYGPIPNGLCVLHRCDNPSCVNPEHLFLGTVQENNIDRDTKGRHVPLHGSELGNARLHESDIPEIRELLASGLSQQKIADRFGVSQKTIWRIAARKAWTHV